MCIYGNNADKFSLRATGTGCLALRRNGLETYCQRNFNSWCGDHCAALHRRYDGNLMLVDLCCMGRETTIKIEKEPCL